MSANVVVVTYSRVSTLMQETDGESLDNQDRAFVRALDRNPSWVRARHYREAASAKTMAGRAEFSRMIAELAKTKPDMIVVDTLDRWTRNLREGLNLLEELRGKHIRLLPLDWRREKPIDLDDDRDWADVVGEFVAAERENRARSRRIRRSYEGRRERGAVTANRTPFGLSRKGDQFGPGPMAWVIGEIDRRYLAGATTREILLWTRSIADDAWTTVSGIRIALFSPHYVAAGVRSPETAAAIAATAAVRQKHFGMRRKYDHEFTGVFRCGRCGRLMHAQMRQGADRSSNTAPSLVCEGAYNGVTRASHDSFFIVRVAKIQEQWDDIIGTIATDDAILERWAGTQKPADIETKRRALLRRLAAVDSDSTRLRARRDRAFDLLSDADDVIILQARKMLGDVQADEMALATKADAIRAQLVELDTAAAPRDVAAVRAALARYRDVYAQSSARRRNLLNQRLCAALGSHPSVDRTADNKWGRVVVSWPELLPAPVSSDIPRSSRPVRTRT